MNKLDLVIIGAGPVGLASGIIAKRKKLNYVIVEKGVISNSITGFPYYMTFFTTAKLLEIGGHPFPSTLKKPERATVLDYYRLVVENEKLNIQTFHEVETISGCENKYILQGSKNHPSGKDRKKRFKIHTKYIIIATGYFDNPKKVKNIEGINLPHVFFYYKEPHNYYKQNVVVIGAGNSGAEAALELFRHGANVSLVHKYNVPKQTIKYWVSLDLENRLKNNEITPIMPAEVLEITREFVLVRTKNEKQEVAADAVFILTGFTPHIQWFSRLGLKFRKEDLTLYLTRCFESSKDGIFVVGSAGFGKFTNAVFIENGRKHAEIAVEEIANRVFEPNYVPSKEPLKMQIISKNT